MWRKMTDGSAPQAKSSPWVWTGQKAFKTRLYSAIQ
jgi:hypothetical protein